MSGSGHSSKRHKKKNPIDRFFDRLRGKSGHRPYRDSEFPGIHLPKDYDPKVARELKKEKPDFMEEDEGVRIPESLSGSKENRPERQGEKLSFFARIDHYFRTRSIRKEERQKERYKRKLRRKHQKEYYKEEKGRTVGQKLLNVTQPGEFPSESKIPFFSQQNALYRNMTITVNSTVIFLLTYIIAYLFYWITCLLVAAWYGLDSTLYFYDLKFNDHSNLWTRFNILMVTGIPPFLSLFAALWLFRVVIKLDRFISLQKLFILWLCFHLFNRFFGAFPSGVVTDEGFGYVAAWMYMNTAFKFLFSLVSLFILGLIGYHSAERILETSDSMTRIKPENRVAFILTQMALPWFIGALILFLVRMPENFKYPYETLMLFSMGFLVIPPFFDEKVRPRLNLVKVKKRRSVHVGYLAMMLVMLVFLRIMLGIGLHFMIRLEISISPAIS